MAMGSNHCGKSQTGMGYENLEKQLENEDCFHGELPREEIKTSLVNDGDFIIRTSTTGAQLKAILCVMWRGSVREFEMVATSNGFGLTISDKWFRTPSELIQFYRWTQEPLSTKQGIQIKTPISRPRWLIPQQVISIGAMIGSGQFVDILRGSVRVSATKTIAVAVKKSKLSTKEGVMCLMKEFKLAYGYRHAHIVRTFGFAAGTTIIGILMEVCQVGALADYIKNKSLSGPPVSVEEKKRFCLETATGMNYLHSMGCIHRDLAARNILLSLRLRAKIADFGMSVHGSSSWKGPQMERIPARWCAPEALDNRLYSSASDVFSFGVLMWEVFSDAAQTPWGEMPMFLVQQLLREGKRLEIPQNTPRTISDLMEQCWNYQAEDRPSFNFIQKSLSESYPNKQ